MFTKILVPTDFSAGADHALAYARTIAERFGGSLQLLHVAHDPAMTMMISPDSYVPDLTEIQDAILQEAMRVLNKRLTASDRSTLHATAVAFFGSDARSIVEYAREHGIDLIVMGTHGRTGMSHLLMGSVAERVVRTAPCAVMTVLTSAAPSATARPNETAVAVPA